MVGMSRLELDIEESSSPSSVFHRLCAIAPALENLREGLRCAIDQEYACWDDRLGEGSELAFISPTAGG
jgi:molybdopterin converting factor small subunit